ncbi:uncharacterized protein FFB20_12597 [Fusarium fujikuroi]|nr:uncharacterized protein FFB20_12597 [Fusarium fujikuroi]SCO33897.1 uncharacterized protein FFNC_03506 [Fusarium fujikuroi]VZI10216.1 unnamed protein product [Fusarium fujikuroi]
MAENPNPGGFNRLACVIFPSSAGSTGFPIQKSCITGEVDLKHLRRHLKSIHECQIAQCAKPCEIAAHRLSDKIKDIVKVRKRRGGTAAETWIRMFKQAYPHHENVPAPYLPCPGQLLALAQHPTEEFMKLLRSAFADNPTVGMDIQAHDMAHKFCQLYPTFYEVVSRTGALPDPQTWLQLVATTHQPGAVLSSSCRRPEPSLDNGSIVATSETQQDSISNTDAAVDMPDCDCNGQSLLCQKCFGKELDRFDCHPNL